MPVTAQLRSCTEHGTVRANNTYTGFVPFVLASMSKLHQIYAALSTLLITCLLFSSLLSPARGIIIHPNISNSSYLTDVTTTPFFVVLNALGDCAGSIIAGSDPRYVFFIVRFIFVVVGIRKIYVDKPMDLFGNQAK